MNISMYKKAGLFFVLATIIPWSFWFLASYLSYQESISSIWKNGASIIALFGLLSPLVITIILAGNNKEVLLDLRHRLFNFSGIRSKYIVLSVVLMPFSILLAQAVSLLFGYSITQFQLAQSFSFTSGIFPVWFMLILAPVLEELAWHSYGTDALRSRYNLFTTSVIFALFWGIWHLPLSAIKDYYHSNLVEEGWIYSVNFLLSLFPFVIIMNWIYYKANRNIILPVIFHITAGYFNEVFATHPMSKVIQTGLLVLYAIYIIIHDKSFFFSKSLSSKTIKTKTMTNKKLKSQLGVLVLLIFLIGTTHTSAQDITQSISGKIYDDITEETLPFANIVIKDSDPLIGAVADIDGNFILEEVSMGRQTIVVSMIGYDTYEIKELMVSSGQMIHLDIGLQQSSVNLEEVIVRVNKSNPINSMSTLSSRQFTVEETQRYAGGFDDPARLASSFAGVSNPSISDNGISVRGNNPDGLLWRIDGLEIPNPNHFANLTIAGGGLLSSISPQMMGNSDFYTGAFPAEFGNASSGVFDIRLREGNQHRRQYAFEAGILGVGAMAQGPIKKQSNATFIVNYRNSTMALLAPILPDDAGLLKYQDLSFKTNFPTQKYGTFTLWGIGALDGVNNDAVDSTEWKSYFDRENSKTKMHMYATALTHKISMPGNAFIKSSIAITGNGLEFSEERLDYNLTPHPQSRAKNNIRSFTIQSEYSKKFNHKHSNKTGVRYNHRMFDIDVKQSPEDGELPIQLSNQTGSTVLGQVYSQSKIQLKHNLVLNAGINAQYLHLNKNLSVEPRIGIKYQLNKRHSLSAAYGIHSRMEQLPVYFALVDGDTPNKDLELMQSFHYVLSYHAQLGELLHMTIEPYYQQLSHVPVSPTGYESTLNNNNNLYFDDVVVSEGTGRNVGIDFTLERFLSKGYYFMLTGSVFDARYTGADGVTRNTRFNKNFVFNLMTGKEWEVKDNNIFSANIRINYLGGNRIEPINMEASFQEKDVVYGETNGKVAFSKQHEALPIVSLTLSYRKNKPGYSTVWSLQVLNVMGTKAYSKDFYNLRTHTLDTQYDDLVIPNLSYRIEF